MSISSYELARAAAMMLAVSLAACGGPPVNTAPSARKIVEDIPTIGRQDLGQRRIFFGHQSVGANILSGIQALSRDGTFAIEVVEGRSSEVLSSRPALAHAGIGRNLDPISKIRDFAEVMRAGMGAKADIAFLKFCYVDFQSDSNIQEVFDQYKATLAALKIEFPRTTFVHVTAPLTVVQRGPKAVLKSILGKKPAGVTANIARQKFNEMLRHEYEGKAPIFDLAAVESTYPDGSKATFQADSKSYPKLIDDYTSDGGHLNENGARWVAAHLIRLLATLPRD
jgi:hypothetical protein